MGEQQNPAQPLQFFLNLVAQQHKQDPEVPERWPPDCLAAADLIVSDQDAVTTLLFDADLLMESAAEHGWSIVRCLEEGLLVLAAVSGARTVLECTATGLWLLDGDVPASERIRRSLIRRWANVNQQRLFARSTGNSAGALRATERLGKICSRASALNIAVVDGNPPRIGGPNPGFTDCVSDVLGMEASYRTYSGVIHGNQSFICAVLMESDPQDPRTISKAVDPKFLGDVVTRSIVALHRFEKALTIYRGQPADSLDAVAQATREWLSRGDIYPCELVSQL